MNATDYHHENIIEIKERFWRSFPIVWMSAHPAKCTAAHLDWPACCVWQHERSCALEIKSTNTHASLKGKHTSPVTPQPPFFPFSLIVTFPRKVPCCHTFKQCSRDVWESEWTAWQLYKHQSAQWDLNSLTCPFLIAHTYSVTFTTEYSHG